MSPGRLQRLLGVLQEKQVMNVISAVDMDILLKDGFVYIPQLLPGPVFGTPC
jgi:hypothetical protein